MLVGLGDEELESWADEGEGRVTEVAMEPAIFTLILWVGLVAMGHGWPERGNGSAATFVLEVIVSLVISPIAVADVTGVETYDAPGSRPVGKRRQSAREQVVDDQGLA